jgi:SEL1 protein
MFLQDLEELELLGWEVIGQCQRTPGGSICLLNLRSQQSFKLVQLRNDAPWAFVADSAVELSGAHGSEIVRCFTFLDQVRSIFYVLRLDLTYK